MNRFTAVPERSAGNTRDTRAHTFTATAWSSTANPRRQGDAQSRNDPVRMGDPGIIIVGKVIGVRVTLVQDDFFRIVVIRASRGGARPRRVRDPSFGPLPQPTFQGTSLKKSPSVPLFQRGRRTQPPFAKGGFWKSSCPSCSRAAAYTAS